MRNTEHGVWSGATTWRAVPFPEVAWAFFACPHPLTVTLNAITTTTGAQDRNALTRALFSALVDFPLEIDAPGAQVRLVPPAD